MATKRECTGCGRVFWIRARCSECEAKDSTRRSRERRRAARKAEQGGYPPKPNFAATPAPDAEYGDKIDTQPAPIDDEGLPRGVIPAFKVD
jgi:hypothetical protein